MTHPTHPLVEVLPIGAKVDYGPHKATVCRIQIGPQDAVVYEIGYWTGVAASEWREVWVYAHLLESTAPKVKIGFLP